MTSASSKYAVHASGSIRLASIQRFTCTPMGATLGGCGGWRKVGGRRGAGVFALSWRVDLSLARLGDCAGLARADTLLVGMQYDRRVIGYHACSKEVADRLLLEGEGFKHSTNAWDWLGHGIYFWEFGLQRAYDWAQVRCLAGRG